MLNLYIKFQEGMKNEVFHLNVQLVEKWALEIF